MPKVLPLSLNFRSTFPWMGEIKNKNLKEVDHQNYPTKAVSQDSQKEWMKSKTLELVAPENRKLKSIIVVNTDEHSESYRKPPKRQKVKKKKATKRQGKEHRRKEIGKNDTLKKKQSISDRADNGSKVSISAFIDSEQHLMIHKESSTHNKGYNKSGDEKGGIPPRDDTSIGSVIQGNSKEHDKPS